MKKMKTWTGEYLTGEALKRFKSIVRLWLSGLTHEAIGKKYKIIYDDGSEEIAYKNQIRLLENGEKFEVHK